MSQSNKIKIFTTREVRKGAVFHYTPFILHSLFPEVINETYKYDEVIRERNIDQTVGYFNTILEDVLGNKHTELSNIDYNSVDTTIINCEFYPNIRNRQNFDKFRNFIFSRYNINPIEYDKNYPEVLLIKRHDRVELLDSDLKNQLPAPNQEIKKDSNGTPFITAMGDNLYNDSINTPWLATNGKERREIDNIDIVESYMQDKFGNKFRGIYLELISFEEQVKYFNNAKFIVCAHGGGQANQFFCKPATKIIEVTCNGKKYPIFDQISSIIGLDHVKCTENEYTKIINFIESNIII